MEGWRDCSSKVSGVDWFGRCLYCACFKFSSNGYMILSHSGRSLIPKPQMSSRDITKKGHPKSKNGRKSSDEFMEGSEIGNVTVMGEGKGGIDFSPGYL